MASGRNSSEMDGPFDLAHFPPEDANIDRDANFFSFEAMRGGGAVGRPQR